MRYNGIYGLAIAGFLTLGTLVGCAQPNQTKGLRGDSTGTSTGTMNPLASSGTGSTGTGVDAGRTDKTEATTGSNTGGQVTSKMYFPTGSASDSALLIEKSQPSEVTAGKSFDYDIKVTNVAKMPLEGVEIQETLPANLKVKDVAEGSSDGKPQIVRYSIPKLEAGETKILHLQATASGSGLMATCLSARYYPSLCMATNIVAPSLKLELAGPTSSLLCDPLNYKLVLTNNGTGSAKNIKIDATLPEGLTAADGKNTISLDAGTLGAGQNAAFTLPVKAAKPGAYAVKAVAKADDGLVSETAPVNVTVKQPVLTITKTGQAEATLGQPFGYEIVVTNTGDAVAKNVSVVDAYPAGITVQGSSEKTAKPGPDGKIMFTLGDMNPGDTKKINIAVSGEAEGDLQTGATVNAVCAETKSATMKTKLKGVPAILVEVIDEPDPVRVGGQTVYTISITNQGTTPLTNVKPACDLEDSISFVSVTGPTKETLEKGKLSFAPIGILAPKSKAVYKLTVKAEKEGDSRFKTNVTADQFTRPIEENESTTLFK